jgi:hypothetical protein
MSTSFSETKAGSGSALQLWCARLTPALSGVLLPELIRLTAEYARPRHCWSAALSSKRTVITDAAGDARRLHWDANAPGAKDEPGASNWWCALSEQSLGQYAGDSAIFSWTIRVDEWVSIFAWGVESPGFATRALTRGVSGCSGGISAHGGSGDSHSLWPLKGDWKCWGQMPTSAVDPNPDVRVVVRCTANLKTDMLSFSFGLVDANGHIDPARVRQVHPPQSVPGLAKLHFYAGSVNGMKVTLLDD